ncbi:hypothetical protein MKW94_016417 [Papaver nudicaule]|uniref:Uncharacterized protein n=1 Tax=Papaver nudicaule TaxID=74823 RepID=A0AA41UW82_PAPNU|nr:hypothetical protein [Papaver nudicaule]
MAMVEFSSYSDLVAINSGDGIKVFDAMKGEEFSEIESGFGLVHTCMKWLDQCLLVVGTASGEVMALDLFSGQLKWRLKDCHPGGVNAVSFSTEASCMYSAGVDGMVCQTDPASGNLLGKFKASTKAISSMVISPDGKTLATAAVQLKIFNCSNNKKIQKFPGHTGAVRCIIFSEDGKYLLYSSAGESYVALWEIDGSKKQSASCVLSMDHPAVFLDCKGKEGDTGIYVLAVSEVGQCYFWYGKHVEELRNAKPTRISLSAEGHFSMNHKSAVPMIFAAVLQVVLKSGSGLVHLVYGSIIKPSFEKMLVTYGTDLTLNSTHDGVLLPLDQSQKGVCLNAKPRKGRRQSKGLPPEPSLSNTSLLISKTSSSKENKRRTLQKKDIDAAITRTDTFDFLLPTEDLKDKGIVMPRAGPVPVGGPSAKETFAVEGSSCI